MDGANELSAAAGFADRGEAGDRLATALSGYANRSDVTVLGLPRGGVPVAARVAAALHAPLDVLVVRKLGVPWSPEVAFGAVGPGGVTVHNRDVEAYLTAEDRASVQQTEEAEVAKRQDRFRPQSPPLSLTGRIAIVVDDGLATGATARVAAAVARGMGASRVVVAVPVGSPDAVATLRTEADEVVCLLEPPYFDAVGRFYAVFDQTTDDEVAALLHTYGAAMSAKRE